MSKPSNCSQSLTRATAIKRPPHGAWPRQRASNDHSPNQLQGLNASITFSDQNALSFAQNAMRVGGEFEYMRQQQHVDGIRRERQRIFDTMHLRSRIQGRPEVDQHLMSNAARRQQVFNVMATQLQQVVTKQIGQRTPQQLVFEGRDQASRGDRIPSQKVLRKRAIAKT